MKNEDTNRKMYEVERKMIKMNKKTLELKVKNINDNKNPLRTMNA